ncbi:hypothetical protein AgCh_018215 [Apium graveolens]
MPVSSVASEAAFSTGGRIIDAYRSSLSPKTAEALVCSQDWLRSSEIVIDQRGEPEEYLQLEKLEYGQWKRSKKLMLKYMFKVSGPDLVMLCSLCSLSIVVLLFLLLLKAANLF